jgi:NAD(P)-dependent dehydrogenase (short-subunit alcohol dehydrogenase family)
VTGSTQGIGEATVRHFADQGARVVVTGRSIDRGNAVASSIRDSGGEAIFVPADLANEGEIRLVVERAVDTFGGLTTLVNNGFPMDRQSYRTGHESIRTVTPEVLEQVMSAGLYGLVYFCKHAFPAMEQSGGGAIVNVGSASSALGYGGIVAGTAAKGALHSLTRSIAVEGASSNIRCNALIVGSIPVRGNSDLFAAPGYREAMEAIHLTRLGEPKDVAYAAAFLVSDEAAFITGALLAVDGGVTCRAPVPDLSRILTEAPS